MECDKHMFEIIHIIMFSGGFYLDKYNNQNHTSGHYFVWRNITCYFHVESQTIVLYLTK